MRWRLGEGLAAGSFALFVALVPYRSAVPQLLGRWSYLFGGLLAAVLVLFLVTLAVLRRPPHGPIDGGYERVGPQVLARSLDLGSALWGAGYLVGSLFDPASRGRILLLDLFGSGVPAASFLEWGGAVVVLAGCLSLVWSALAERSVPGTLALLTPFALVALGEGAARWYAAYRPRPTEIATAADARWTDKFVVRNTEGYRDRNHAPSAAARTSRLLVVGGTDAFGAGVNDLRDRFAEQVASRLEPATGGLWEPIVAGARGAGTVEQMAGLMWGLQFKPAVVLFLYSFDDAQYLVPSARFRAPTEGASGWRDRVDPLYLLYQNSVLFQEAYLRMDPSTDAEGVRPPDPYATPALLAEHLEDLKRLVAAATDSGRVVAVVPVDVEVASDPARRFRYRAFLASADSAGIPVWSAEQAFQVPQADALIVDRHFRHPNASANAFLADLVATRLRGALPGPAIPIIIMTP